MICLPGVSVLMRPDSELVCDALWIAAKVIGYGCGLAANAAFFTTLVLSGVLTGSGSCNLRPLSRCAGVRFAGSFGRMVLISRVKFSASGTA